MDLSLVRTEFEIDGIFSELRNPSGKSLFVTLEHAYPDDHGMFVPKLPNGVYTCKRYFSPEHGYKVFQIMDVPPFMGVPVTYLELHIGNFQKDSKGCVLLGLGIAAGPDGRMIMRSKVAFDQFMAMQAGLDSFMLTVTGG